MARITYGGNDFFKIELSIAELCCDLISTNSSHPKQKIYYQRKEMYICRLMSAFQKCELGRMLLIIVGQIPTNTQTCSNF